jgi:hypothetical protein
MSEQPHMLPAMGAPLRVMTREQIDAERILYQQTGYNVTHRARVLGVHRSTLDFHLACVKGGGRVTPRIQRLIAAGNAMLAMLPKDETSIAIRAEWAASRAAYTRRVGE